MDTRQEAMDKVISTYQKGLKDNYIKSLVQGFEVATQMYIDKLNSGCTMEELKEFMEKNLDRKNLKRLEKTIKN